MATEMRQRLSRVVAWIRWFVAWPDSARDKAGPPAVMDRLRAEIQAIDDELPKLDPTPCGMCGCVIGEGLMQLHTDKCHPDRDRTPGTRHGVYGPRFP